MSKMARSKGQRGEREVISLLQPIIDRICEKIKCEKVTLTRNCNQSIGGGSDICGLDFLAAEVKNCETQTPGLIADWWKQTSEQAEKFKQVNGQPRTPVLFYMRNRQPTRVRMLGVLWQADASPFTDALVDVSFEDFAKWFGPRCEEYLRIIFNK